MKNIVVKGWMVAIAVFVVLFGGIYLTIGTGHWSTTREAEPIKLETGAYNPADIRGSYTFAEVEQFFGVPTNVLFNAFKIPEERRTKTFQIKNMEGLFAPVVIDGAEIEVGTDLVRVFTSIYSGIPYTSDETTHLPLSVVDILIKDNKLDAEQIAYWKDHAFDLVLASEAPAEAIATPAPEAGEEAEEMVEIKGGTTMGKLLEYGLTKEQFKEITGIDMPDDRALGLRDFVMQNGLDMETVKTKLLEVLAPAPVEEEPPVEEPQPETSPTAQPEETPSPAEGTEEQATLEIKGRTTIGELLDYGLTPEQFKDITGLDLPDDREIKVKDFADKHGLDSETLSI